MILCSALHLPFRLSCHPPYSYLLLLSLTSPEHKLVHQLLLCTPTLVPGFDFYDDLLLFRRDLQ